MTYNVFGGTLSITQSSSVCLQCESKSNPPPSKSFCNIFAQAEHISMKFCQFIASLYPLILDNILLFWSIYLENGANFSRSNCIVLPFRVSASPVAHH